MFISRCFHQRLVALASGDPSAALACSHGAVDTGDASDGDTATASRDLAGDPASDPAAILPADPLVPQPSHS